MMKKLPIDVSTFSTMINGNYTYVDKTQYIYNLIESGRFYFLSRPRRFGKSLLISTLKELFLGNKDLFKGLWIDSSDYTWQQHPVIHLNFSDLDIETSPELKISLSWELESIAQEYGIDVSDAPSAGSKLKKLVKELAKKSPVVILIDEYDYPLINNLSKITVAQANRDVLKNFFSVIKSLDAYLKAIFVTGVTKFSKTSIFSGLNNLNDLTLAPESSELLGYTQAEIESYFTQYIDNFAHKKENRHIAVMQEMKTWYNGYRFSRTEATVYNPFSVLYYLKNQERANYWFESGTPSFLVEFLRKHYDALEGIEQAEFSTTGLGTVDLEDIPPTTLLFQTGYFTISDYDSATKKYKLGYPNEEVRDSFQKYLLAAFSNKNVTEIEKTTSQLVLALKEDNVLLFCELLQSLLAHIPYQLHIAQERYYHSLFQLIGKLLGFDIQSEISTDKGRIDLVFSTVGHVYLFELKFKVSAAIALKQIEEQRYYEKYLLTGKKITLIGLSFKHTKHKLTLDYAAKNIK